ncbi:molybdopterin-dependent oxidoreductase [Nonomuraea fuscirosea]|uniref:molybdopterin-dependent oxidoreductase n=1 Tax=Nonomuraea fuscirosea TaxID=1291556 RepID=UPI003F4D94DD
MSRVDRIAEPWGTRTPYGPGEPWPVRVNTGRLGPKDLYGWQANHSPDRLTRPLVREGGRLVEAGWDTAMDLVAGRAKELLDEQGPSAIGSFTDLGHADVLALYGHNTAATQTVLWTRVLDRLAGPNPPAVICVDPRERPVARAATGSAAAASPRCSCRPTSGTCIASPPESPSTGSCRPRPHRGRGSGNCSNSPSAAIRRPCGRHAGRTRG